MRNAARGQIFSAGLRIKKKGRRKFRVETIRAKRSRRLRREGWVEGRGGKGLREASFS